MIAKKLERQKMQRRDTQMDRILSHLKERPLNSFYATYEMAIKQAPEKIHKLRRKGYKIKSIHKPNRSVDWLLLAYPGQAPEKKDRPYRMEFEGNIARRVYLDEE